MRRCLPFCLAGSLLLTSGCESGATRTPVVQLVSAHDSVDGAVLHYQTGGSGPPLLLLHGFMGSGMAWQQFADTLGRHYSLIVPDLPGHGYSTGLPASWGPERVARQMLQLLERIQVGRIRAIGCSAGADVLLHMARLAPERLEAAVLISASHRLAEDVRGSLRSIPPMEELGAWRDWNARHSPHGDSQVRALLQSLRGIADNYDDFSTPLADLRKIPTPILIVTGDQDTGPSLDTELELHRNLPGSSLWVVPDAGHCPFWSEVPGGSRNAEALFPSVVLTFLSSH